MIGNKLSVSAPTGIPDNYDLRAGLSDIVLKIAKEVGEILKDVPYVKSAASTVLQIIKIREVLPSQWTKLDLTKSIGDKNQQGSVQ